MDFHHYHLIFITDNEDEENSTMSLRAVMNGKEAAAVGDILGKDC